MVGGVHGSGRGVCVAEGHVWQRVCMAGSMHGGGVHGRGAWKGGVHGRGHVWQEGMCGRGDMCGRGACMAGKTAIAAGGTHPTGMHSCLFFFSILLYTGGVATTYYYPYPALLGFIINHYLWKIFAFLMSNQLKMKNVYRKKIYR